METIRVDTAILSFRSHSLITLDAEHMPVLRNRKRSRQHFRGVSLLSFGISCENVVYEGK